MDDDIFPRHKPLLTPPAGNAKLRHSQNDTHAAWSLSLSAGARDICSHATAGCLRACVSTGGLAAVFSDTIGEARRLKTQMLRQQKNRFVDRLEYEIRSVISQCCSTGITPLFRLNAFSEIRWESLAPQLFSINGLQAYDYAKNPARIGDTPHNYRLTFSRSEDNEPDVLEFLRAGVNCSVVFHELGNFAGHGAYQQRLPQTWRGYRVLDGDESDHRSLDPTGSPGYVIGLRLKGGLDQRKHAIETGFSVPFFA
jgi:hypothetical protein